VKVVITGDGGDEVFAGYPRYKWDRWADRAGRPGAMIGHLAEPVLTPLASGHPSLRRMGRFLRSLTMAPDARYAYYVSKIDAREKGGLFTRDLLAEFDRRGLRDSAVLDAAYRAFPGGDRLSRRLYGDLKTSLADEMLAKVDLMSMAASLEARPPLLDHHLVEFAATLPSSDKLRGGVSKFLLRRAAEALLPAEILRRPKHGFEVPVGTWLRGALKGFGEDVLFSARASSRGFWRPDAVRELWARHQSGESGLGDRLWVLLNWELWCQVVADTPVAARVEASR
jgi:asparagine synthase (glutamine-hydrolysing)